MKELPKIRNYIEHVVALYTDVEFKSHFRLVYIHYIFIHTNIAYITKIKIFVLIIIYLLLQNRT